MKGDRRLSDCIRAVIAIGVAALVLPVLVFMFLPDAIVLLAWHYSAGLPRSLPWFQEAILVVAVVCWIVLVVVVAWLQLRSFKWRGFR